MLCTFRSLAVALSAAAALPAAAAASPSTPSGDFLAGLVAYERGDYGVAHEAFANPALAGVPEVQDYLGRMYFAGRGVTEDVDLALTLLAEAAEGGVVEAARLLAKIYDYGVAEVPPDSEISTRYWKMAAELGDRSAMVEVGLRYKDGSYFGDQPDFGEAVHWLGRAAAAGDARAMTHLGDLYEKGQGVASDPGRAEELYRTAAGKGYSLAMERLARDIVAEGGDLAEARTLAETAVLREGQPAFHDTLGTVLRLQGDLAGAEEQYLLAMKKSPLYAQPREHLADLYWEQGRREEAEALWREARDLAKSEDDRERIEAKLEQVAF